VNAVLLLMGLLVLSYLGSFLVGGRTVRGAGLPSGVEYVALGFVLGPSALDLVGGDMLASFEPVVQVALGWLAFAVGLDFGYAGERRARAGNVALATLGALVTGGAVAGATWMVVRRLHVGATMTEQLLLAGGVGVIPHSASPAQPAPSAVRKIEPTFHWLRRSSITTVRSAVGSRRPSARSQLGS